MLTYNYSTSSISVKISKERTEWRLQGENFSLQFILSTGTLHPSSTTKFCFENHSLPVYVTLKNNRQAVKNGQINFTEYGREQLLGQLIMLEYFPDIVLYFFKHKPLKQVQLNNETNQSCFYIYKNFYISLVLQTCSLSRTYIN